MTGDRSLEHWEPDLFIFLLHDLIEGGRAGGGEDNYQFRSWILVLANSLIWQGYRASCVMFMKLVELK